ncbi:O-antigen ligase family protein [Paenibacillus monticola]|uniref:O-antigen ligase-related domain-containing protein n=1 Tax=Paenibacillus monticola TaxID=2666075 RepID=A0A7X2H2T5_9BACL|nr:O-antigen ligase family protein [Paenibacillus monticola]MRN51648.1 hypothetical protein [Paenibacillus monticola]
MMKHKPIEEMSFCILLVYIFAGALGAGYFYTRSFLALDALLYTAVLITILRSGQLTLLRVHAFLLLLIVLYWFSVAVAVDHEQALLEAARISSLLPLSLLFAGLSQERRDRIWSAWAWSGALLTLWGLAFGLFREGRLESTFGYANVFALLTAAGLVASWRSYKRSGDKRYWMLCAIQLVGLLLSGSRAVLILVVVGVIIHVFMNRQDKKTRLMGSVLLAALLVVVIAEVITNGGRTFREIAWNAPEFALRRIYWVDAFHLWQEHWLLGVGGGGWAVLYPSVFVRYVHQQYLQIALDTGVFGALAFIGMIVVSILGGLRKGSRDAVLAVVLFCVHLAFDIDLAYPLVFGLFVMLLTGIEIEGDKRREIRLPRSLRVTLALPCVLAVFTFTWLTASYILLAKGESAIARQDWDKASENLHSAQAMLPWSHDVHYHLAAVYSGMAQSEGNEAYMEKAIEEIKIASTMIPENRSYREMLKQVKKHEN